MSRRWLGWVGAVLLASGNSGCGLLCDRYCERMHDRCDRINQNRNCWPTTGCYPAATNPNCCPAPGVYSAQPQTAPYCP